MSSLPVFIRSLLLTTVLSFVAPQVLISGIMLSIFLSGYLPGMAGISQAGATIVWNFLATFGSGCPMEGLVVIGLVCSFVGALFDTYAFYRNQILHGN
ncbi:MAG: hypothetical protein AB4352_28365 [Hormoscilla sp.]